MSGGPSTSDAPAIIPVTATTTGGPFTTPPPCSEKTDEDMTLKPPSSDDEEKKKASDNDEEEEEEYENYVDFPKDIPVQCVLEEEECAEIGVGTLFEDAYEKWVDSEDSHCGSAADLEERRCRREWVFPFLDERIVVARAEAFTTHRANFMDSWPLTDKVVIFDFAKIIPRPTYATMLGRQCKVVNCLFDNGWLGLRQVYVRLGLCLREWVCLIRRYQGDGYNKIVLLSEKGLDRSMLVYMIYCMMPHGTIDPGRPYATWGAFVRLQRLMTWVRGRIPVNACWTKVLIYNIFGPKAMGGYIPDGIFHKKLRSWGYTGIMCTLFWGTDSDVRQALEEGVTLLLLEDKLSPTTQFLAGNAPTCGYDRLLQRLSRGTLSEPIGKTLIRNVRKWFPCLTIANSPLYVPYAYYVPLTTIDSDTDPHLGATALAMLYISLAVHQIGDLKALTRKELMKEFSHESAALRKGLYMSEKELELMRIVIDSVCDTYEQMEGAGANPVDAAPTAMDIVVAAPAGEEESKEEEGGELEVMEEGESEVVEVTGGPVTGVAEDDDYGSALDKELTAIGLTVTRALLGVGVDCFEQSSDFLSGQTPVFRSLRGHQFATLPCWRGVVDNSFSAMVADYYPVGVLWHSSTNRLLLRYGDVFALKCTHKRRCMKSEDGEYLCVGFMVALSSEKTYVLCYSAGEDHDPEELPLHVDVGCIMRDKAAETQSQCMGLSVVNELRAKAGSCWFPWRSYFGVGDGVLQAYSMAYLVKGFIVCDVKGAIEHAADINIPMLLVGKFPIPAHAPFKSAPILCSEKVTSGQMGLYEGMDSWCSDQQYLQICKVLQDPVVDKGKLRMSHPRCMIVFDFNDAQAAQVALCIIGIFGMSLPVKLVAEGERAVRVAHIATTRYEIFNVFKCDVRPCGEYLATSEVVADLLEQQLAADKRGSLRDDPAKPARLGEEALEEVGVSVSVRSSSLSNKLFSG